MAFFSSNSADYAKAIQSLIKPTYQSKYGTLIDNQLNKILNKESFSYDFNADPLYQNYKDQYTKLGKEAAMNAAAATSTLTGGYGNSYAGTAAAQANQQYLTQLNERIPELYNAAMNKYQMETEDMYNKFNLVQGEENRLYGQYRDSVSDYYSDLSDLRSGHSTAQAQENADRDYNYKVSRDAVSDSQWQKQYDTSNYQWQSQFDYQKQRDAVADSQWEKEYQLALQKARSGSGSGGGNSKKNGTLSNGYQPDYSSNNIRGEITKIVTNAAKSNDWSVDAVGEYINELASRKVLDTSVNKSAKDWPWKDPKTGENISEADWYYETSLLNFPQYSKKVSSN